MPDHGDKLTYAPALTSYNKTIKILPVYCKIYANNAAKFIGCLTYRVRFRWKVLPNGCPCFYPSTPPLCSLTPVAARAHCSRLSRAPPLRSSSLSSVSLLPRLSHFSESASGERPRGSKVLPCPPRPQPLTASELTDDRRLWHISGQPPSGFGPKEKVHTSRVWKRSLGGKNSEAQSGNGLEVAGCHVRGKSFGITSDTL